MELTAREIAEIAHGAECLFWDTTDKNNLKRVEWKYLNEKDRQSLANFVKYVICSKEPVGVIHNKWVEAMKRLGATDKLNANITEWHLLPKEKRVSDVLYICTVRALACLLNPGEVDCAINSEVLDSFSEGKPCTRCNCHVEPAEEKA